MALNKDRVFKAAETYIKKNKVDKAIQEYESWLKENPKDWNIIRTVGDLYARISRNDEAIKKYAQVADHYRKDGFNVRAIATYKMVLRLDPQNEPAMRNLAELQAEEGLLMEAKSYYQTLVELYNKQGHKRLAAEVFKKLAEIDPQDVKIRYKYADFLNKNGKPDEAAREYVGIADAFIGQGLVDEAIKILEQGRSLQTADPALKIKLAHACTMQGNHAQAIRLLEEVRKSASGDPTILARLGEAYLAAGNTDDAQSIFQQLSSVQPGNPENILRLADLRIAQGEIRYRPRRDRTSGRSLRDAGGGAEGDGAPRESSLEGPPSHQDPPQAGGGSHHTQAGDGAGRCLRQPLRSLQPRGGLSESGLRRGAAGRDRPRELAAQGPRKVLQVEARGPGARPRARGEAGSAAFAPGARPRSTAEGRRPGLRESKPGRSRPHRRHLLRRHLRNPPSRRFPIFRTSARSANLGQSDSDSFSDLSLEEVSPPSASASGPIDLGEVVELTQEEEENIKEKLTEAEVFVRYGLVDKAIGQLVDVLESFRYHGETREKLIEIYKDQGMNREAGEQLMQLAQVYDKFGRAEDARRGAPGSGAAEPGSRVSRRRPLGSRSRKNRSSSSPPRRSRISATRESRSTSRQWRRTGLSSRGWVRIRSPTFPFRSTARASTSHRST